MRILIGYTNHIPEVAARCSLPDREATGDDILAFGADYTHLAVKPDMDWQDILALCPPNWTPDVYIHWSPEYNPVPTGVENADCLTVGVFGDWNLGGRAMRAVGGLFDVLVADKVGCERLRGMGFENVLHSLLWACDPQKHRLLGGNENRGTDIGGANIRGQNKTGEQPARDIDVLMIGNFNHAVQWERAAWLARVAGLVRRYKVVLTSGLYDEAYVQTMNRAKIVFNRSIRGEANMRAYEACACGALMFYEAANREIRDIYTDGEHCVLYDDGNLEERLAYYLAPENAAERERIARNGWERVQRHSYAHHFAELLRGLEPLVTIRSRSLRQQPPVAQTLAIASHWLLTCNVGVYHKIDATLNALASRSSSSTNAGMEVAKAAEAGEPGYKAEIANLHAVLCGEIAHCAASPVYKRQSAQAALRHAAQAAALAPRWLVARFNHAYLTLAAGEQKQAESLLREVANVLDTPEKASKGTPALTSQAAGMEAADEDLRAEQEGLAGWRLHGVTFPRRFDWFDVAVERWYGEHAPDGEMWRIGMRALLTCRVHLTLAEMTYGRGQFADSARHAERAARACPTVGEAHYAHAVALRALGRVEDAIAAYRQTLAHTPFNASARDELARLRLDAERADEAVDGLDAWLAILEGCPPYADLRPGAETLRRQARRQLELQMRQVGAKSSPSAPELSTPEQAGRVKRLLALPDWRKAGEWQGVVKAFAQAYAPSDPVLLMLRADPADCPDAHALLRHLEHFLRCDLGVAPEAMPNITLLHQPLAPADCWKLIHAADAVLADALPVFWRELAHARGVPIVPLSGI